ncbi:MAG: PucR family transcriptional regulator [Candidatus Heteroscillospira sp.]|jgi:purine catabolism regulator
MGFTIKNLVSSPELAGLCLAAGEKGANNLIRNCSVVDCPDGFDWMLPGDFVLTSGYIFQNDTQLQRQLVRRLSELACAGLGVKADKYWDAVPPVMLEEANRRDLPLVSIPLHCTLNEIQQHIFRRTCEQEDTLLQKYFKIHKKLISCALTEQTLDAIVANTAELIGNPIIVADKHWRLLSWSDNKENTIPLDRELNLNRNENVFPQEFFEKIPKDIKDYKKAIKRTYQGGFGTVIFSILPIRANTDVYGYLIVCETVRKLRSVEYMGLEQAAITIALERIKTQRVDESRRIMRQDFFTDLLEGRIESRASAYSLAEVNGLAANRRYVCAVMRVDRFGHSGKYEQRPDVLDMDKMQRRITRLCSEYFQSSHINTSVFSRSNYIISLITLDDRDDLSNLEPDYQELISGLYDAVKSMAEKPDVVIGVGGGCADILELKRSFNEALEAIRISGFMASPQPVNWFEKLMVYNILGSGVPQDVLQKFYESSVGQLASYDKENNTNLLETLEVYLLENRNISAAAQKLYIHRNTMNYRINKIKQVLGTDFDDSEKLLKLQIGIRVMRIMNHPGN